MTINYFGTCKSSTIGANWKTVKWDWTFSAVTNAITTNLSEALTKNTKQGHYFSHLLSMPHSLDIKTMLWSEINALSSPPYLGVEQIKDFNMQNFYEFICVTKYHWKS